MKITTFLFLTLLFSSCYPNEKRDGLTADQLVQKAILALGGYDSIKSINSLIIDGHYIEPGYNLLIKAHIEKMRPNFRVIGDPVKLGFAEGFDGASWEYFNGKIKRTVGEAEAATRRGAEFDYPFVDWEEKGHTIELLKIEQIEGLPFYPLKITLNDGWVLHYYFDVNTFLPFYYRKAMPLHAKGENINYLVSNSDFRKVKGVLIPFSSIERNIYSGTMINATIVDSIRTNTLSDKLRFSPPKGGK